MDFQISEKHVSEKITILTLAGRLTAASASQLKDHIKRLVDANRSQILLDISALAFLDSSGLAVMVSGLKLARERGGWLKLAGAVPQVATVFKLTMLDRIFEPYPSVEAALREA